jgi:GR25 family glycosyltransferase involved in LPS biosynthesis
MKYFIISLNTQERHKNINNILKIVPEAEIFNAVNGYNIEETKNVLNNSKLKFIKLQDGFSTYGTLACFLSKYKMLQYQIINNIDYICFMEDDIIINTQFKYAMASAQKYLEAYSNINIIRFCKWGECYMTSLNSAKRIINKIHYTGIIKNIDNQLRENCGKEIFLPIKYDLFVKTNEGDCLKTQFIN